MENILKSLAMARPFNMIRRYVVNLAFRRLGIILLFDEERPRHPLTSLLRLWKLFHMCKVSRGSLGGEEHTAPSSSHQSVSLGIQNMV